MTDDVTPRCFKSVEVLRPQSRAENCCDDCPWQTTCLPQAAEQATVDKIVAWLEDQCDMCCDACAREIQSGQWKQ